ncbi:MAG TPA: VOC family protein [Chloroflexota bacterium]|jgi:catechol 2,3-dioxygenase-like lactoylglutathione lyase family enzyme
MAKIKHIAIRTEDTEGLAKFFQDVFGLELVQRRGHGPIDLTDGDVNITLLPLTVGTNGTPAQPGFEHIGFTVENDDETRQKLVAAGATEMNPVQLGDVYYESKFRHPDGMILDVGHWSGTSPLPETAGTGSAKK